MRWHFWAAALIASSAAVIYAVSVPPFPFAASKFETRFGAIHDDDLLIAREQAREMFYFGYHSYLNNAFPLDELDPIHCRGRGHDHKNAHNFNINDILGDFSLTLIDSLTTLVVLGDKKEFHRAVGVILDTVSFEHNVTVQVFEITIRIIGALLSSHLILTNENPFHGDFTLPNYDNGLLKLAHSAAKRLLPAFEGTKTGLPFTRVNLRDGVVPHTTNETCTAGAGSLLLEFGVLSRLLGDDTFEHLARRVNAVLWSLKHPDTGLLGNVVNIQTGRWSGLLSGLGAGVDSFFEYMLKAYILFGELNDLEMFNKANHKIRKYLRRGRPICRFGDGDAPFYVNADMRDGTIFNTWIDSLQASFPGVLTLSGKVDEAICLHAFYYVLWQKYDLLPERYNWHLKAPDVLFYPLRPEFVESTYLLYLATKNPFYQHVGLQIIDSINLHTRTTCGFATVHNVLDKSLEDRMESFFLSETCKYLYLLFDIKNPANRNYDRLLFSTEGHTFPINSILRRRANITAHSINEYDSINIPRQESFNDANLSKGWESTKNDTFSIFDASCEGNDRVSLRWKPPLEEHRLFEYLNMVGLLNDEGSIM